MSNSILTPPRGFRDLLPVDFAVQDFIFQKASETCKKYGFERYDGPHLENIELYLEKSSRELVEEQTFRMIDKKGRELVLRPEMTPSLARMIANHANMLNFPLKWCNIGPRFRYEAPQKGRERQFSQIDFDIIGANSALAEIEIFSLFVDLFTSLGVTKNDFQIHLNSRSTLHKHMQNIRIESSLHTQIISVIDKMDKLPKVTIEEKLTEILKDTKKVNQLMSLLENPSLYNKYFEDTQTLLENAGIMDFVKIDPTTVRGFDYYTGMVFEVKSKNTSSRSLAGGGRYDNLIGKLNPKLTLSGVGGATSDVILESFLKEIGVTPELRSCPTKVLIASFPGQNSLLTAKTLEIARKLRIAKISTELYLEENTKLDKQLKYALQKGIPHFVIIGEQELHKGVILWKNLKTREQIETNPEDLISSLKSL